MATAKKAPAKRVASKKVAAKRAPAKKAASSGAYRARKAPAGTSCFQGAGDLAPRTKTTKPKKV